MSVVLDFSDDAGESGRPSIFAAQTNRQEIAARDWQTADDRSVLVVISCTDEWREKMNKKEAAGMLGHGLAPFPSDDDVLVEIPTFDRRVPRFDALIQGDPLIGPWTFDLWPWILATRNQNDHSTV